MSSYFVLPSLPRSFSCIQASICCASFRRSNKAPATKATAPAPSATARRQMILRRLTLGMKDSPARTAPKALEMPSGSRWFISSEAPQVTAPVNMESRRSLPTKEGNESHAWNSGMLLCI